MDAADRCSGYKEADLGWCSGDIYVCICIHICVYFYVRAWMKESAQALLNAFSDNAK